MTTTLAGDGDRDEAEQVTGSLFDDPEFTAEIQGFVDNRAPRVFAVVQERRDPEDAQIVAWGITTGKETHVHGVHGGMHMLLQAPENALIFFREGGRAFPRIMWAGGGDSGQ